MAEKLVQAQLPCAGHAFRADEDHFQWRQRFVGDAVSERRRRREDQVERAALDLVVEYRRHFDGQLEFDARRLFLQPVYHRNERGVQDAFDGADTQRKGMLVGRAQFILEFALQDKKPIGVIQEARPGVAQPEAGLAPVEQLHAEFFFQRGDPV